MVPLLCLLYIRLQSESFFIFSYPPINFHSFYRYRAFITQFSRSMHVELWGSGGVRHGLDAAKLFALGASSVGFAKPMLQAALQSSDDVLSVMASIEYELRVAMFCTGSRTLNDLKEKACL